MIYEIISIIVHKRFRLLSLQNLDDTEYVSIRKAWKNWLIDNKSSHYFVTWNLLLELTLTCISKMPVLYKRYSHGDFSWELEGSSNFLVCFPHEKIKS